MSQKLHRLWSNFTLFTYSLSLHREYLTTILHLTKANMMDELKYILNYNQQLKDQVRVMIAKNKLKNYLLGKYKTSHNITTDKALYNYIDQFKKEYFKKSAPLTKAKFDSKIDIIHNALGTHHFISKVQGKKLKSKNEIYIASIFKNLPSEFLTMIVVHELSHFKQKEHNKAFYNMCQYIYEPYHQVEFDLRLYLTYRDLNGKIEEWS